MLQGTHRHDGTRTAHSAPGHRIPGGADPAAPRLPSPSLQINVETYGGGLWYTWYDRDLGLAGRVLLRDGAGGGLRHRLVKLDRPLLRIPMLVRMPVPPPP